MKNALNWFEIPTEDFDRAVKFYNSLYDTTLTISDMEEGIMQMAILPHEYEGGVGGAIIKSEGYLPSTNGTLIYLNAGADVSPMLERAVKAGGSVVMPKMELPRDLGHIAIFTDSEGNKIGLHAFKQM